MFDFKNKQKITSCFSFWTSGFNLRSVLNFPFFFFFFLNESGPKLPCFCFLYTLVHHCVFVCLFGFSDAIFFIIHIYIYMRMYLYTSWALNFFLNQVFCCWFTLLLPKRRAIVFCFFVVFFSLPHFFILYLNVDFFGEKESVWLFSQCIFVQIYI